MELLLEVGCTHSRSKLQLEEVSHTIRHYMDVLLHNLDCYFDCLVHY